MKIRHPMTLHHPVHIHMHIYVLFSRNTYQSIDTYTYSVYTHICIYRVTCIRTIDVHTYAHVCTLLYTYICTCMYIVHSYRCTYVCTSMSLPRAEICTAVLMSTHTYMSRFQTKDMYTSINMGWPRLVRSIKIQVSFAEYNLFIGLFCKRNL